MSLQFSQVRHHAPITKHRPFGRRRTARTAELFGPVARLCWPSKTAAEIASRVGVTPRAAERWMAGKRQPSAAAAAAIVSEIFGYR
jgi:transcriptional regulator with XRE-family HTH domain